MQLTAQYKKAEEKATEISENHGRDWFTPEILAEYLKAPLSVARQEIEFLTWFGYLEVQVAENDIARYRINLETAIRKRQLNKLAGFYQEQVNELKNNVDACVNVAAIIDGTYKPVNSDANIEETEKKMEDRLKNDDQVEPQPEPEQPVESGEERQIDNNPGASTDIEGLEEGGDFEDVGDHETQVAPI